MVNHNLRKLKIFVCVNKLVVVSIILAFSAYTLAIITPDYSVPKTSAGGLVVYDKSGNPMMRADGSLITIGDLNQAIDGIDPDDPQFLSDVASYTDPEGSEQQSGMAGSEMAGIMSGAVLGGALLGGLIGLALKKKNAADNLKKAIEGDPTAKEELEGFAKEKTNLQELAKSAKKALAELKKVEKSTDKNLETIDKEHEKVNRALEEAKDNHEKVKAQLLEQQKLLDEEAAKKTQAEEEQVRAKKALDDSNSDLEAKQKALEEAKSKSGSDDEKKVAIDEAEKALAEAQKAATTAQNNFDEASKKLQEVAATHALALNQQAELAKNVDEAVRKVALAQSNVDIIKDSVDQAKSLKDEVVQKKTELEQKLQTAQDSQVELAKRVRDAAEDSVKKAEEEISDVKRQIAEAKKASIQAIGGDNEAKKAADEQVKLLSKQLVQAEDKLKGFKVGLDKADAELKKISPKQAPVSAPLAIGADAKEVVKVPLPGKGVGAAVVTASGSGKPGLGQKLSDKIGALQAAFAGRKQEKNASVGVEPSEVEEPKTEEVDHYIKLGVAKDATKEALDTAFAVKKLALKDDLESQDDGKKAAAQAEVDALERAHAELADPEKKKAYDLKLVEKAALKVSLPLPSDDEQPHPVAGESPKPTKKEQIKAIGNAILNAPGKLIAKAKAAIDERKQKNEEEKKAKGIMVDASAVADLEAEVVRITLPEETAKPVLGGEEAVGIVPQGPTKKSVGQRLADGWSNVKNSVGTAFDNSSLGRAIAKRKQGPVATSMVEPTDIAKLEEAVLRVPLPEPTATVPVDTTRRAGPLPEEVAADSDVPKQEEKPAKRKDQAAPKRPEEPEELDEPAKKGIGARVVDWGRSKIVERNKNKTGKPQDDQASASTPRPTKTFREKAAALQARVVDIVRPAKPKK